MTNNVVTTSENRLEFTEKVLEALNTLKETGAPVDETAYKLVDSAVDFFSRNGNDKTPEEIAMIIFVRSILEGAGIDLTTSGPIGKEEKTFNIGGSEIKVSIHRVEANSLEEALEKSGIEDIGDTTPTDVSDMLSLLQSKLGRTGKDTLH